MSLLVRRTCRLLLLSLFPLLASCETGVAPTGALSPNPSAVPGQSSSKGAGFTFLQPIQPPTSLSAAFDGTLPVSVRICPGSAVLCAPGSAVASFATEAGDGDARIRVDLEEEAYSVTWHAGASDVALGTYRIHVLVGTVALGGTDVQVVDEGTPRRGAAVVVNRKQSLPIKFRIAQGVIGAAVTGPSGGEVAIAGGGATVSIPAGALGTQTTITVSPASPEDPSVIPGTAFEFGPDGIQFGVPALITLKYDETRLPRNASETALGLFVLGSDGIWRVVPESTVDPSTNTVSGKTTHFSLYAVRMFPCKARSVFTVGSTSTGELNGNDCAGELGATFDYYEITLNGPTTLFFEATSSQFGPNVRVFDSGMNVVANAYADGPARIFTRVVLAAGTYTFWVGNLRNGGASGLGAYNLAVRVDEPWSEACVTRANAFIAVGGSASNSLRSTDCPDTFGDPNNRFHRYALNMSAGQSYRVTLTTSTAATLSVWSSPSKIEGFRSIPSGGTLTYTYQASASGYHFVYPIARPGVSYTISVAKVVPPAGCNVAPYQIGASTTGAWATGDCANSTPFGPTGAAYDQYELNLNAQRNVRFALSGADGRTLRVRRKGATDYVGLPLGSAFLTVEGNTLVQRHMLAAGDYIIEVQAPAGTTGAYTLNSVIDDGDIVCRPVVQGTIGIRVEGTLNPATDCPSPVAIGTIEDWVVLPLKTGDRFRITMTSATMPPGFVLRDDRDGPASPTLARGTVTAPNTVSLDWTATFDTFHEIVMFKNAGPSVPYGAYTLTIERLP